MFNSPSDVIWFVCFDFEVDPHCGLVKLRFQVLKVWIFKGIACAGSSSRLGFVIFLVE